MPHTLTRAAYADMFGPTVGAGEGVGHGLTLAK